MSEAQRSAGWQLGEGSKTAAGGTERSFHLMAAAVLVGLASLYFIFNPGNRTETADGFWYADRVETEPWRSLPFLRHFAYLPLMRLIFRASQEFAPTIRAYDVMTVSSAVFAVACVGLLIAMLYRRFGLTAWASILAGLGLGLSFEFWRYAVEAEVYSLGALTSLGAMWFVLVEAPSSRSMLLGYVLGAVAFASNALTATLLLAAIPVYFYFRYGLKRAVRWLLFQGVACAVATIAMILFIQGDVGEGGVPSLVSNWKVIAAGPVSFASALISTNALNGAPLYLEFVSEAVPSAVLDEERYLARFIPNGLTWFSVAGWAAISGLGILLTIWGRRIRTREGPSIWRGPSLLVALWLGFYALAVFAYGPGQEVWILALVPFWMLLATAVIDPLVRRQNAWIIVALITLLGIHNLVAGLWVMAEPSTDFNRTKAAWLIENAGQSDLVVTLQGAAFARYLRYFSDVDVLNVEDDLAEIDISAELQDIERHSGRVFFTNELFLGADHFRNRDRNVSAAFVEAATPLLQRSELVSTSAAGSIWRLRK